MAATTWTPAFLLLARLDPDGAMRIRFLSRVGSTCTCQYSDVLGAGAFWNPFVQGGSVTATNLVSESRGDQGPATSGALAAGGVRFYRFQHNAGA